MSGDETSNPGGSPLTRSAGCSYGLCKSRYRELERGGPAAMVLSISVRFEFLCVRIRRPSKYVRMREFKS